MPSLLAPFLLLSWLAAAPATVPTTTPASVATEPTRAEATAETQPQLPSPEDLEQYGATIGRIEISGGDIFDPSDPAENYRLYTLANRLHIKTRQRVILQLLLFEAGDPYSRYLSDESERILRSQRYLYDAQIRAIAYDEETNVVDLVVVTRDVWTLKVGLSIARSGGENETRVELEDSNFLGTGKELTLKRSEDVDRTSYLVRYRDPNVGGRKVQLETSYQDNSDGFKHFVQVLRPFVSLQEHWAAGFEAHDLDRVDPIYQLGEEVDEFRHRQTYIDAFWGRSNGLQGDTSHRWLFGFTYLEDRFGRAQGKPEPTTVLEDRTLSYPWIGFQSVQNRYRETRNLNRIGRTEDLELGRKVDLRLGLSPTLLGSDEDRLITSGAFSFSTVPRDDHLLQVQTYASARWSDSGVENLHLGGALRYYLRMNQHQVFFATLEADLMENRDPENQLLLGGDSGLRGYPLRYQDGDRRLLLTLEQRLFTDWHPFRLARVGGAVFLDVGRAWFSGNETEFDQGWLTDVGFGLRLSSSRSGFGSMLHLDVAFPLGGDDSIDNVQWLISTKESF